MSSHEILIALRRIMRAIDLHSKQLQGKLGLTVPQLIILQYVSFRGEPSISEIARGVSLSQGTVTAILSRLEVRKYLTRRKSSDDKRKISVRLTQKGQNQVANAPELLQKEFVDSFEKLEPWDQKMLTAAVERIAAIMDAETMDAAPILQPGEIVESPGPTKRPGP